MDASADNSIPQWKKDLILRIRNKSKWSSDDQQQLLAGTPRNSSALVGCAGQQPSLTCSSAAVPVINLREGDAWQCNDKSPTCTYIKMVKERVDDHKQFNNFENVNDILENGNGKSADSGSSEELHYGPGIVNKLKNRYLSLTLRESNVKTRPSILPMRKATSLEHLLDDDVPNGKPALANSRLFQSRYKENDTTRNASNRYYNATRVGDLKRARSVETISRSDDQQNEPLESEIRRKHESLHEDMLIVKEGSDKHSGKMYDNQTLEITSETRLFSNAVTHVINRPKRITPIMSEKEKPPVDVVKQTKKIFERGGDHRTKPPHQTGEVAAKVATYKNIIGQSRNNKKPPIPKQKPVVPQDNNRRPISTSENTKLPKPTKLPLVNSENGWITPEKSPSPDIASTPRSIPSPIPDVSRISSSNREVLYNNNQSKNGSSLSETPDLILHSSPIKNVSSPTFRILATDNFLKAEINHSNSNNFRIKLNLEDRKSKQHTVGAFKAKSPSPTADEDGIKTVSSESRNKIRQAGNSMTYNLSTSPGSRSHLPIINKEMRTNSKTGVPQLEKNTHTKKSADKTATNSQLLSPSSKPLLPAQSPLTPQEIEKNNKNTAKTLEQVAIVSSPVPVKSEVKSVEEVKKTEVPKTTLPRESKEQNSIVFKFTDRKEVPDYVGNDGRIRTGKIEKPKVGEGGIILLPGATLDESLADDDEDWMLSLEGPPSPCDVMFINDNVLIDGRSSLSHKNKKLKMKLKFVDSGPDIFEYPSEASLLDDSSTTPSRESSPGHIVPTLSGSSLANYIPKSGSTEDFQLGITRSMPTPPIIAEAKNDGAYLESTLEEVEEPVLFSAGTNSDILF